MLNILKQNLLRIEKLGKMMKANLAEDAYAYSQRWRHAINHEYHEEEQRKLYDQYCEKYNSMFLI